MGELPVYLRLEDAAQQYHLDPQILRQAIANATLDAARVESQLWVDQSQVAVIAAQVQAEEAADELVTLNEAARRLNVPSITIVRWLEHGWLQVLATGSRKSKLVSWSRARELGRLYQERERKWERLTPENIGRI